MNPWQCPNCGESTQPEIILRCGHSFCQNCAEKLEAVKNKIDSKKCYFVNCRENDDFKQNYERSLSNNIEIRNLINDSWELREYCQTCRCFIQNTYHEHFLKAAPPINTNHKTISVETRFERLKKNLSRLEWLPLAKKFVDSYISSEETNETEYGKFQEEKIIEFYSELETKLGRSTDEISDGLNNSNQTIIEAFLEIIIKQMLPVETVAKKLDDDLKKIQEKLRSSSDSSVDISDSDENLNLICFKGTLDAYNKKYQDFKAKFEASDLFLINYYQKKLKNLDLSILSIEKANEMDSEISRIYYAPKKEEKEEKVFWELSYKFDKANQDLQNDLIYKAVNVFVFCDQEEIEGHDRELQRTALNQFQALGNIDF